MYKKFKKLVRQILTNEISIPHAYNQLKTKKEIIAFRNYLHKCFYGMDYE